MFVNFFFYFRLLTSFIILVISGKSDPWKVIGAPAVNGIIYFLLSAFNNKCFASLSFNSKISFFSFQQLSYVFLFIFLVVTFFPLVNPLIKKITKFCPFIVQLLQDDNKSVLNKLQISFLSF